MCETKHCHNTKENDLLKKASQIELKRQDIIQQLKNDCKSVSNRINQWIIALVSLIGALIPTFVADCPKINMFVRLVPVFSLPHIPHNFAVQTSRLCGNLLCLFG